MMKIFALALCGIFLLGIVSASRADTAPAGHDCRRPLKPRLLDSQWQIDNFNAEVDRYRQCLETFVRDQEQQMEGHRSAAEKAAEEWNAFVKTELQEPEEPDP